MIAPTVVVSPRAPKPSANTWVPAAKGVVLLPADCHATCEEHLDFSTSTFTCGTTHQPLQGYGGFAASVGKLLDSPDAQIALRETLFGGTILRSGTKGNSTCVDLEDDVFNWQLCAKSPLDETGRQVALLIARSYTREARDPVLECKDTWADIRDATPNPSYMDSSSMSTLSDMDSFHGQRACERALVGAGWDCNRIYGL